MSSNVVQYLNILFLFDLLYGLTESERFFIGMILWRLHIKCLNYLLLSIAFFRYRLRSQVEIDILANDFSCWQRFGKDLEAKSSPTEEPEAESVGWGGTVDTTGMTASHGNKCGWEWNKDPRLDCLGFRGIFPSDTTRKFLCSISFNIPLDLLRVSLLAPCYIKHETETWI